MNRYLAAFNNANQLTEQQKLFEFENSLVAPALSWITRAPQNTMNYTDLCAAFI